ncbi:MAG TPA: DUF1501 domain-containing protein, partial [Candidatus Dormibacteraeota bacterium]|nr:DUF1501 domain-containing protein [Candidatus Dormibacteraeota bacterium]
GLLDSTLVLWASEFGRTPMMQGSNGRQHNAAGFTLWMAGGGVQPGLSFGETDDLGYEAVVDKVSVHDLKATMLHLLGFDHHRLTFPFQGLNQRVTNVTKPSEIVQGVLL